MGMRLQCRIDGAGSSLIMYRAATDDLDSSLKRALLPATFLYRAFRSPIFFFVC